MNWLCRASRKNTKPHSAKGKGERNLNEGIRGPVQPEGWREAFDSSPPRNSACPSLLLDGGRCQVVVRVGDIHHVHDLAVRRHLDGEGDLTRFTDIEGCRTTAIGVERVDREVQTGIGAVAATGGVILPRGIRRHPGRIKRELHQRAAGPASILADESRLPRSFQFCQRNLGPRVSLGCGWSYWRSQGECYERHYKR